LKNPAALSFPQKRESGTRGQISNLSPKKDWIPASAGMTICQVSGEIQFSILIKISVLDLSQTILAVFGAGEIETRTAMHFGKNSAVHPFQTKEVQHVLLSM